MMRVSMQPKFVQPQFGWVLPVTFPQWVQTYGDRLKIAQNRLSKLNGDPTQMELFMIPTVAADAFEQTTGNRKAKIAAALATENRVRLLTPELVQQIGSGEQANKLLKKASHSFFVVSGQDLKKLRRFQPKDSLHADLWKILVKMYAFVVQPALARHDEQYVPGWQQQLQQAA